MESPRRVVTKTDGSGKAVFAHDGPTPRSHAYVSVPGMRSSIVWATGEDTAYTGDDPTLDLVRDVPSRGETRMVVVDFAPATAFADPALDPAALAVDDEHATPMLAQLFEVDEPGMHRSPTVDYAVVVSGQIYLELDDGAQTLLHAGDLVVQNATRHRWRNPTQVPCRVAFTWIGVG